MMMMIIIIIDEINMINNVNQHPIPPTWRHEKSICLKTGCHANYCIARCTLYGNEASSHRIAREEAD